VIILANSDPDADATEVLYSFGVLAPPLKENPV
jgi:hypothetical protein